MLMWYTRNGREKGKTPPPPNPPSSSPLLQVLSASHDTPRISVQVFSPAHLAVGDAVLVRTEQEEDEDAEWGKCWSLGRVLGMQHSRKTMDVIWLKPKAHKKISQYTTTYTPSPFAFSMVFTFIPLGHIFYLASTQCAHTNQPEHIHTMVPSLPFLLPHLVYCGTLSQLWAIT